MCRFLRLVTQEALFGKPDSLKEYRIGTEVFDKDESFDPRIDPIVRNEARRLRRKIEMYYVTEGKSDPVAIDLPKGGYIPVFAFREIPREPAASGASLRWRALALATAATAVLVIGSWLVVHRQFSTSATYAASRSSTAPPHPIAAAVEAYTTGRYLLFKLRAEDILASRAQLETAIGLDPDFAEAFASLALNYQVSMIFGLSTREAAIAKSRELIAHAAALSRDGAAELALGSHSSILEEQYAASEQHFLRALARDPNDGVAHACYAVDCLLQLGRVEDARREARAANARVQNDLSDYALVITDYCARDYRSAIVHAQEALQIQSDSESLPGLLIDSYLAQRNFDEAWFFVEKSRFDQEAYQALIQALKGDKDAALNLARIRASANAPPVMTARLFAAAGDAASAIHWLEEAGREREFNTLIFARYCPEFDTFRSSAAFASMLETMSKSRRP
jgi:tetratricopeptide (TPR) repeat protein